MMDHKWVGRAETVQGVDKRLEGVVEEDETVCLTGRKTPGVLSACALAG